MDEIKFEDLPTDGTRFLTTWQKDGENWSHTATYKDSIMKSWCSADQGFFSFEFTDDVTNIRYWSFPNN